MTDLLLSAKNLAPKPEPELVRMTRKERLARWAELVRKWPTHYVGLTHGLEYLTPQQRSTTLASVVHVFDIAVTDPKLQADGLSSGSTIAGVMNYFEVTRDELHEFSCDCGGQINKEEMARRIEHVGARR